MSDEISQKKLLYVILGVLMFGTLGGCQTSLPLIEAAPIADNVKTDYHIGAGDNLQIFVWRNPEFSVSVPVRPDGEISIPLIDDVMAGDCKKFCV